jgi:hypothetical protein
LRKGETIYLAQTIICQRQLNPSNPYIWLRRLYYPNGRCFDQIIDIRNGRILQTNPAPCNPNC